MQLFDGSIFRLLFFRAESLAPIDAISLPQLQRRQDKAESGKELLKIPA
jgi:hypothetical protein